MATNRLQNIYLRDLFILEDETNPRGSKVDQILPSTILDQVYDDQDPTHKNLRQILEDLKYEIITGGRGNIVFPVTTVNGMTGDIVLTRKEIGLGRVDNTADIDKPLSIPQREAIEAMLQTFDFNVNLEDLHDHLKDSDNPHHVTLEQLNVNDSLADFIRYYIGIHNLSTYYTTHIDIRRSLATLWCLVDDINNSLDDRLANVLESLNTHQLDDYAHEDLFSKKEDVENKATSFSNTENKDHTKYPTTRAVVEFVLGRINQNNEEHPNPTDYVADIQVVNTRDEVPNPSVKFYRKAYIVRWGQNSFNEVAVCRKNPDGTYSWDYSDLGSFTKLNPKHLMDSPDGLSINLPAVVDAILDEDGVLDATITKRLEGYYTAKEIDDFHFINDIKILPGTMNGTIRYYINDDLTTMSDDVKIPGLQRLAYLEWITEKELWDNAVRSNHIRDANIETRHIQDRAVTPEKLTCKYGYVLGNADYPNDPNCHEIKYMELADILRPLIGGWPDPSTPGGNPWYDMVKDMVFNPNEMKLDVEYELPDGRLARRFRGKISVIMNMDMRTPLNTHITTDEYRISECGGSWCYQSDPEEWTMLSGSNITGHTFATIVMTRAGLFLESISIGDRYNAEYDIWVKYVKKDTIKELE